MKKLLAAASAALLLAASVPAVSADALEEKPISTGSASRYYYDLIDDSDKGKRLKQLYDYLADFSEKLMASDEDFKKDELYVSFDDETDPVWAPDFKDLDYTDFQNLVALFTDDNPYYYILRWGEAYQYSFRLSEEEEVLLASSRKEFAEKAKAYVESYSEAADIPDLYDRARFIHDKLCLNMKYSFDEKGQPSEGLFAHSVYGPIMMKEGVCDGYARIYQMLCNYYGIECIYVIGRAASNEADADKEEAKNITHAWNLINLGDDEYYWVDVTWDDTDYKQGWTENYKHKYFAVGSETIERNHTHHETVKENIIDTHYPSMELPWTNVSKKSFIDNHPERFPKDAPDEAFVYTELDDGTLELTEFKDQEYYENAVIPDEVNGKKVTKLAEGVFENASVKKVVLPKTVTVIPKDCFSGSHLHEINLDSITEIQDNAFLKCYELSGFTLPEGLTSIGDSAFMFISVGPEKIVIPESVKSIGNSAFRGNEMLSELVFPENSEATIGSKAFEYCISLKNVTVPESITEIGEYAFGYTLSSAGLKQDGFVMRCYENSAAHKYAVDSEVNFELITNDSPSSGSEADSASESQQDSESTSDSSSVPDSSKADSSKTDSSKTDSSSTGSTAAPSQNPKTGAAAASAAVLGIMTVTAAVLATKKRK